MANRWDLIRVSLARRFFIATVVQGIVVLLTGTLLARTFGRQLPDPQLRLPWAFVFSSIFLAIGSVYLERARSLVKREKQAEFRQSLLISLGFAMAFVTVQGYGLWAIDKGRLEPEAAQLGVHGFVVMLTAIHAMHFVVAQSVLLWVTLSAYADRYDHEYFWGVTFAACLWHGLGVVWCGILVVFSMALVR